MSNSVAKTRTQFVRFPYPRKDAEGRCFVAIITVIMVLTFTMDWILTAYIG